MLPSKVVNSLLLEIFKQMPAGWLPRMLQREDLTWVGAFLALCFYGNTSINLELS